MCGIVGYIGNNEKKKIIIDGLRELEYRGYDSSGIAVLEGGTLATYKSVGKLNNLESKLENIAFNDFGLAIGHTRWATHGRPTEINAHPHFAEFSSVIHNGIIENYKELRDFLESKNYHFISQTDTEVIVHLFEENLKSMKPLDAFKETINKLKGAYAILLISKIDQNKIFYAKNASPLIIARGINQLGEKEIFFASSDSALIGLANEVSYLEDGEIGAIGLDDFDTIKNLKKINITKSYAQKDGFRFFMEKEIYEQEKVMLETMLGRVDSKGVGFDELDKEFFNFKSISICACGTSYHSGLVAKYLIERKARVKTSIHIASEFKYANSVISQDELFIVISQSGETADTLEALKLAKKAGLKTLAICNVDNSSIVRLADYTILTRAGIEKGVASTKAYATQVMILWILAINIGIEKGQIDSKKLKQEINSMLGSIKALKIDQKMHEKITRLSKRYLHGHGFFFIGKDVFYPLALEGALKLKEISYLHAEGYPSGEMKHGPIALADSELFTFALMPNNLLYDKIKSNVEELSARNSTICAISPNNFDLADDFVKIKKYDSYMEEFFSMLTILQLLALEIAIRLGNDVDMPRNLAKSVTVE